MTTVMERIASGSGERRLFDLPVDQKVLFSDHNDRFRKGLEKRRTKLVEKLAFLKPFLEEDERILLVTTGCSPMSVLEQVVTGWIVYALKRSLLVFTDRRIFHIPTKSNLSYRHSIAHIRYPDCKEMFLKRGCLNIRYQDGTKEVFTQIDRRERKKIMALLAATSCEGARSATGRRAHLCPRCTAELVPGRYDCPNCRLVFKNLSDGRKLSILYPGGGYFYTRHPLLGAGDALTELILTALVIMSLLGALKSGTGYVPLAIWGTALLLEKAVSVYHSNHFIREYIPEEKEVRALGGTH